MPQNTGSGASGRDSRHGLLQNISDHNKLHPFAPVQISNPTASMMVDMNRIEKAASSNNSNNNKSTQPEKNEGRPKPVAKDEEERKPRIYDWIAKGVRYLEPHSRGPSAVYANMWPSEDGEKSIDGANAVHALSWKTKEPPNLTSNELPAHTQPPYPVTTRRRQGGREYDPNMTYYMSTPRETSVEPASSRGYATGAILMPQTPYSIPPARSPKPEAIRHPQTPRQYTKLNKENRHHTKQLPKSNLSTGKNNTTKHVAFSSRLESTTAKPSTSKQTAKDKDAGKGEGKAKAKVKVRHPESVLKAEEKAKAEAERLKREVEHDAR